MVNGAFDRAQKESHPYGFPHEFEVFGIKLLADMSRIVTRHEDHPQVWL